MAFRGLFFTLTRAARELWKFNSETRKRVLCGCRKVCSTHEKKFEFTFNFQTKQSVTKARGSCFVSISRLSSCQQSRVTWLSSFRNSMQSRIVTRCRVVRERAKYFNQKSFKVPISLCGSFFSFFFFSSLSRISSLRIVFKDFLVLDFFAD